MVAANYVVLANAKLVKAAFKGAKTGALQCREAGFTWSGRVFRKLDSDVIPADAGSSKAPAAQPPRVFGVWIVERVVYPLRIVVQSMSS